MFNQTFWKFTLTFILIILSTLLVTTLVTYIETQGPGEYVEGCIGVNC